MVEVKPGVVLVEVEPRAVVELEPPAVVVELELGVQEVGLAAEVALGVVAVDEARVEAEVLVET